MALALVVSALGIALLAVAGALGRHDRERALATRLGMTPARLAADADGSHEEGQLSGVTGHAVDLVAHAVDRVDRAGALQNLLDRAKVRLRPAEFVVIVACGALAAATLAFFVTRILPLAVAVAAAGVVMVRHALRRRITKAKRAFEAQLPDALSLVGSSLSAGHTFLRAIQMMSEESAPPISTEFARLVGETRLGDSVVDALERMAMRLQIRDLDMVVQAIRIQQTVGGRLADLFQTLSDVIRSRNEVKREVKILTAEGRMSAYVLAALVPFLFVCMRLMNPDYVQPLFSGTGLFLLIGCAASVVLGLFVILRMVTIEV